MLPDATGFQMLGKFRSHEQTKSVPIILMTGAARSPNQQKLGRNMGAQDYILKPFNVIEVGERVRQLLGQRPPAEAPPPTPEQAPVTPPAPEPAPAEEPAPAPAPVPAPTPEPAVPTRLPQRPLPNRSRRRPYNRNKFQNQIQPLYPLFLYRLQWSPLRPRSLNRSRRPPRFPEKKRSGRRQPSRILPKKRRRR